MEELVQLKEKLAKERPVSWAEFPDIGLYKDQVVSYMYRQLIHFDEESQITSAMINNYIKDKLLPRADGKKYSREHLAGLTEIGILKQVLSVGDTGYLLQQELQGDSQENFYEKFRQILDRALTDTSEQIDTGWDAETLQDMALRLAVSSYCEKLVSERLLDILRAYDSVEAAGKPDKKQEKKQEKRSGKKHEDYNAEQDQQG